MISVKLFSIPAPGQCVSGESTFLGTVRINMHKASILAIATPLKQYIRRHGLKAEVEIIDMQNNHPERTEYGIIDYGKITLNKFRVGSPFESVRNTIKDADIIGLSINYTHSRIIMADFIRYAKSLNERAVMVIGGTDASAEPGYYLKLGADIVVKGEGEKIFEMIVHRFIERKSIYKLAGTYCSVEGVYVDNVKDMEKAPVYSIQELVPQELEMVDFNSYDDTGEGNPPEGVTAPFISVETSRGCAEACSFCATPFMKGKYKYMAVEKIIEHLNYYWKLGVRTLLFQEDNILSRIHRQQGRYIYPQGREDLLAIFKYVREMGFCWEFSNGLQFGLFDSDNGIDYELVSAMFWNNQENGKQFGCYRATIPLENLSDQYLKKFRKLKEFERSKQIIRAVTATNVYMLNFNLIIGRPEDDLGIVKLSYQRCEEVKELVKSSGTTIPYFNIYNLSLLPGTVDYRNHKTLLAFDLEKDPEVVTFYLGSLNTRFFNSLEISEVRGSFVQKINGDGLIREVDETRLLTNEKYLRELS